MVPQMTLTQGMPRHPVSRHPDWLALCRQVLAIATVMIIAVQGTAMAASDGDRKEDDKADRCISLSQIRNTEIVDDRTILFRLRNGTTKKATLAFTCPSLSFYKTFGYEVYSNRLCARVDAIITRAGSHCPISQIETLPDKPAD